MYLIDFIISLVWRFEFGFSVGEIILYSKPSIGFCFVQDKNSELETRLSEYETDRVEQLQQQSMLDSQLKQMEEVGNRSNNH